MGNCLLLSRDIPRTETITINDRTTTDMGDRNTYRYVDTTSIPSGSLLWKDFVSYPGRGTKSVSYNCTSVPNYNSLTVDNVAILYAGLNPITDAANSHLTRSYNASNGTATITLRSSGTISFDTSGSGYGVAIRVYYVE